MSTFTHSKKKQYILYFQANLLVSNNAMTVPANNRKANQSVCKNECRGLCAQLSRIFKMNANLQKHSQNTDTSIGYTFMKNLIYFTIISHAYNNLPSYPFFTILSFLPPIKILATQTCITHKSKLLSSKK